MLLAAVLALAALAEFNSFIDAQSARGQGRQAFNSWWDLDDAVIGIAGFTALSGIANFVLVIVWMFKAHAATGELGAQPKRWSRGWTIGGWFIPVANLLIPKLVMGEIESAVSAPRQTNGRVVPDWRNVSPGMLGWFWWILVFVGIGMLRVSAELLPTPLDYQAVATAAGDIRARHLLQAAGLSTVAVSAICGALYIRSLSRKLHANEWVWVESQASTSSPGENRIVTTPATPAAARVEEPAGFDPILTAKLRELKGLHVDGLLTDEEYELRRSAIVEQL